MVAAYGGRPAAEYFRVDTIARTFSRSNPLGPSRALRNFFISGWERKAKKGVFTGMISWFGRGI